MYYKTVEPVRPGMLIRTTKRNVQISTTPLMPFIQQLCIIHTVYTAYTNVQILHRVNNAM